MVVDIKHSEHFPVDSKERPLDVLGNIAVEPLLLFCFATKDERPKVFNMLTLKKDQYISQIHTQVT